MINAVFFPADVLGFSALRVKSTETILLSRDCRILLSVLSLTSPPVKLVLPDTIVRFFVEILYYNESFQIVCFFSTLLHKHISSHANQTVF